MKLFLILSLVFASATASQGQLLKKLKEKVNRKVDEKIDKALEKPVDEPADTKKTNETGNTNTTTGSATSNTAAASGSSQNFTAYAKFDFVPGDSVVFEDNIQEEDTDEIPSKWLVENGQAEVRMMGGEKVIQCLDGPVKLKPRIKNPSRALGKRWTLEFDMMISQAISDWTGGNNLVNRIGFTSGVADFAKKTIDVKSWWKTHQALLFNNSEGEYSGEGPAVGKWMHVSIAGNERSIKGYINSQRVINVQIDETSEANQEFYIQTAFNTSKELKYHYFKNFRLAKGGKDPYKQVTTDSKFIARGITFEYQSATIKPTSMGELNRIVTMLKDHAELKFEIGGHTSKTGEGSAAANLALSEERAKNVRKKLVELGIDEGRLTAKGFGETKPMADNATAEGRANNQRVEFIKK